jgi:hypothetical protein
MPHQHQLMAFAYINDSCFLCLLYQLYFRYVKVIAARCGRRWTGVQLGCTIGGVRVTMPRGAHHQVNLLHRQLNFLLASSVISLEY